jgi:hypothetical protein
MVLADAVEVADDKLWMLGAGWSRIVADTPAPQGLGIIVHVPFDMTNRMIKLEVHLLDVDGDPVLFGDPPQPVGSAAEFEIGRPPGIKQGERLNFPLALRFNGLAHRPGGYVWECRIENEQVAQGRFGPLRSLMTDARTSNPLGSFKFKSGPMAIQGAAVRAQKLPAPLDKVAKQLPGPARSS